MKLYRAYFVKEQSENKDKIDLGIFSKKDDGLAFKRVSQLVNVDTDNKMPMGTIEWERE